MSNLSVREIQESDIDLITQYWQGADSSFLHGMGADINKLPTKEQLSQMLSEQICQPYDKKQSYCIILTVNNKPIGHSNINKIVFGKEAYMHLHIWDAENRNKGYGEKLVKMALPHFFEKMYLKKLYCEPYSLNPSPNKTLAKIGFQFIKEYITTPGYINFEQPVNLWELSSERLKFISPGKI